MSALTVRLPDEMATILLATHDAEVRFNARAARGAGQTQEGLELLRRAAGV